MAFKKLIIGDVFLLESNKQVVVGANLSDSTQIEESEMPKTFFIELYKNKTMKVIGSDYTLLTKIVDVQVSSNIVDMKNIYFLTDLKEIGKIKPNDFIEIID